MTTAQQVIAIARAEVGYREGFSGGHWNNIEKYATEVPGLEWANGQAWCDVFVCWVFTKAGLQNFPVAAYTGYSVAGWKARNRWSEYPAIGAQVQFGKDTHTGVVVDYDDTFIWTVEGNTNDSGSAEGNGVYLKKHRRDDPYVYGYGYPEYADGIKSADPAWANRAPAPAAPTAPTAIPKPPLEDDMPIFMRTTDTTIWLLKPGAPPLGLSMQQWLLWARLGAPLLGGDFNRMEVDIVSNSMQPAAPPVTVSASGIDVAAFAKALAPLLPAEPTVDDIAKAVRAAIVKES